MRGIFGFSLPQFSHRDHPAKQFREKYPQLSAHNPFETLPPPSAAIQDLQMARRYLSQMNQTFGQAEQSNPYELRDYEALLHSANRFVEKAIDNPRGPKGTMAPFIA